MSIKRIHFQRIASHPRMIVRPLCERANVVCTDANSSPLRHEITCKPCLKRLMATATWARELASVKAELEREAA